MVCLIGARTDLDGSDQEIPRDHKGKVALNRRLKGPTDDSGVIDSRDRGGNVKLRVRIIEEFNDNSRERSGSCIFENVKERKVQFNFSITKHPGLSRIWKLGDRGRTQDRMP